jgi:PAS domain S-box-containing protein
MNIQDLQHNVISRVDNSVVFCRVDQEGALLEAQSDADTHPERHFPGNHKEIVRRCIESGMAVRNVHSGSDYHSFLWDYYPIKHESCVHMYSTRLHNGMYEMKEYESIPDAHFLFQSLYRAPDAVIVYDGSRKILFANLRLTTLTGYHVLELIGKPIETIIPGKYLKRYPLIHEFPNGEDSQIHDCVVLRKNGRKVEVESNEQVLSDNLFMIVLRDNRRRNRLQNDFQEAMRSEIYEKLFIKLRLFNHGEGMVMNLNRLTLFLDNTASLEDTEIFDRFIVVTEEFRKTIYPELISIGRYLEVLRADDDVTQANGIVLRGGYSIMEFADKLKSIFDTASRTFGYENSVDRLRVIIKHKNDIQMMVNTIKKAIKNTTHDIERSFICSPGVIIGITMKKFRSEANAISFSFTDYLDGQLAIMSGSELSKVMEILIENAIGVLDDYSQERDDFDPRIDITLSIVNDKIRIEIKDNGPGIKREHHILLFKDDFTTKGPGHGFGLGYSARCIRKYGGQLTYETRADYGACFVIELLRTYTHDG